MSAHPVGRQEPRPDARALVRRIEQAAHAVERNGALRQLMVRRNARRHLIGLLHHARADLRQATLALLDARVGRRLVDEVIEALQDPVADVRRTAAERLAEMRVRKACDPLIALSRDRDAACCKAALDALGQLGAKGAVGAVSACLPHRRERVRLAAVNSLVHIGDRMAASALVPLLNDDAPAVRLRTVHALVTLKARAAAGKLALLSDDPHAMVRETALWALGALASARGAPTLIRTARTARSAALRQVAVEAMGRLCDRQSASQLIKALQDANVDVRCAAAKALAQRNEGGAMVALAAAAEQETDASALRHMQACGEAIRQQSRRRPDTPPTKANPLWRSWYSWPSLDAGSLIYTFHPNGTGDVEDFAMGVTRGRTAFRYRLGKDRIAFDFDDRAGQRDVGYTIRRSRYRDPLKGLLPCLRLEFTREPYFTRRGTGRSRYYQILQPKRE